MATDVLLLTGAVSETGRAVLAKLAGLHQQVCVLLSDLNHWPELKQAGAMSYVLFSDAEPSRLQSQLDTALSACDRVLHLAPFLPAQEDRLAAPLIHSAQQQDIKHFVMLSPLHSPYLQRLHPAPLATEARLIESGLPFTLLHTAPFMQILSRLWSRIQRDALYETTIDSTAHFSVVDLQDVAEAAAIVVAEGGHEYACYELAGPQPLNQQDMIAIIAAVTGRAISLHSKPFDRAVAGQWLESCSDAQYQQLLSVQQYCSAYGLVGNPNVLSWLLGRQPNSFSRFVESLCTEGQGDD